MNLLEKSGLDIQSQIDYISKTVKDKTISDALIDNLNRIRESLRITEYIEVDLIHFSIDKKIENNVWQYAIWCEQFSDDLVYSEAKVSHDLSKITCNNCRKKIAEFMSTRFFYEKRKLKK